MKNLFIPITVFIFLLCSCSQTEDLVIINNEIENKSIDPDLIANSNMMRRNVKNYSSNEIVVRYGHGITDQQKDSIRTHYNVQNFDVCSYCIDQNIEKWGFDNTIDIETKLTSIHPDEPVSEGILNVDREFTYLYEYENYILSGGGTGNTNYLSRVSPPDSDGVKIAVMDTGIDVHDPIFAYSHFLNNAEGDPISQVISGWDFVNNDDNCYDDNILLHGTAVSSIINTTLFNLDIPHQIIPVKVANANGNASYFDMLCGLQFSLDRADIVNISLGWYRGDVSSSFVEDIFSDLILEYENEVLVVTSAGNSSNDNEGTTSRNLSHYPSNFNSSNVVAVAASNVYNTDIARFSNYGATTVDFFAPGENLPFNGDVINGTSFAAPLVSAQAARVLYESGMSSTPQGLVSQLYSLGTTVGFSRPTAYSKLILPD